MSHLPIRFYDRRDGVYQMIFAEPGTDATGAFIRNFGTLIFNGFYDSVSHPSLTGDGTVTSSTTSPNTGPRCISCSSDGNKSSYLTTFDFGVDLIGGGRVSYYFKISALPAAEVQILNLDKTSSANTCFNLKLGTDGKINIYILDGADNPTVLVGTFSTAVSIDVWYRLCVAVRRTSISINENRFYLNGVLEVSLSNIDLSTSGIGGLGRVTYGWVNGGSGTNNLMFLDDLYVDNNDTLEDTGNIRVTAKLPASNNTNQFATAIGNNPSNRWENVNERPADIANGWKEDSGGPYPLDENYGLQGASVGDFDLSSYSGAYPSLNPGIGVRTSTTEGCNLWECGIVIAFSDTTNSIVGFMSWVFGGTVTGTGSNDIDIWENGALFDTDRQFLNSGVIKVAYFRKNTLNIVNKPIIFSSVADDQPFIFSTRD